MCRKYGISLCFFNKMIQFGHQISKLVLPCKLVAPTGCLNEIFGVFCIEFFMQKVLEHLVLKGSDQLQAACSRLDKFSVTLSLDICAKSQS